MNKSILPVLIASLVILSSLDGRSAPKAAPRRATPSSASTYLIELAGQADMINPADLNKTRSDLLWNNSTPSFGTFNQLTGSAISLGYQFFSFGSLILRYEAVTQQLPTTTVPSLGTVKDSFNYRPILLLLDIPFDLGSGFSMSLRAGAGYASVYEIQYDITASGGGNGTAKFGGNPIPVRAGFTLNYGLYDWLGLFAEYYFESVKSTLKAEANYPISTPYGSSISQGQSYQDPGTGAVPTVDMSGGHAGVGLRLKF